MEPVPDRPGRGPGRAVRACRRRASPGSGYSGHYFWDTEIYVLPFLIYTSPAMARSALRFRYNMLEAARRRAADLAQSGALFPWRTISGEEASAYYAAGTAQYHIDADVAFALCKYVNATGDGDFMQREGVDILVETARMWADLGFWRDGGAGDGQRTFHIHGVTGPDEYTTVVNDNLFTNVMARFNLDQAARGRPRAGARRTAGVRPDGPPARSRSRPSPTSGRPPRRRRRSRTTRRRGSTRRTRTSSTARCGTWRTPRPRSARCCCTSTRW